VFVENKDGQLVPAYVFDARNIIAGSKLLGEHNGTFKQRLELTGKDGKPIEISDAKAALLRGLVPDAPGGGTDQAGP